VYKYLLSESNAFSTQSWKLTLGQKFRGLSPPSPWYATPMETEIISLHFTLIIRVYFRSNFFWWAQ